MPKPIWTERRAKFVREVGSIILGVLIALGLGAVATEIGWRIDVASAREALARELGESVGQGNVRVRLSPCIERRLDAIGRILDEASRTGRLPATGQAGAPTWYTWPSDVWNSTVASNVAAHMPRDEQSAFGGAYAFIRALNETNVRELDVWTRLYAITGPGRAIGEQEIASLQGALREARLLNNFMGLNSVRFAQVVDAFGLPFDRAMAGPNRQRNLSQAAICKPIPAYAGESYGSAPLAGSIEVAIAEPITREDSR